ncbi:MAG TPA: hypothetical protein PLR83_10295 [Pyrinomonadaceae bacterium]|nr:hypothetical protein [Pyrinomonadaceae bacterium]
MAKVFKIAGITVAAFAVFAGVAAMLYWQSLKTTPQYSLALVVDAAKRDDQAELDSLVDVDAITDNFTPQVTAKAVEMYGKGLPPSVIARLRTIALPVMPLVRDRARAALPKLIREQVEEFGNVPFPLIVAGADRYLRVETKGDVAIVESKIPDRPLRLKMTRVGTRWKVTGFEDDALATDIARRIGEELVAIATASEVGAKPNTLGMSGVNDLLRRAAEILQ